MIAHRKVRLEQSQPPSRYRRGHAVIPSPVLTVPGHSLDQIRDTAGVNKVKPGASDVSPHVTDISSTHCNVSELSRTASSRPKHTYTVQVKLPNRSVSKQVWHDTTAAQIIAKIVSEHRLELDTDDEDVILWVYAGDARRPLRLNEPIASVVEPQGFLMVTSGLLRNDVDSLASLVPRRDMLRKLPQLEMTTVFFSTIQPPRWLRDGQLSLKDNVLVCTFGDSIIRKIDIRDAEIYEWPKHMWNGLRQDPAKYVAVIRRASDVLFISTDSPRVYSLLRNAVYTTRTRALLAHRKLGDIALVSSY